MTKSLCDKISLRLLYIGVDTVENTNTYLQYFEYFMLPSSGALNMKSIKHTYRIFSVTIQMLLVAVILKSDSFAHLSFSYQKNLMELHGLLNFIGSF